MRIKDARGVIGMVKFAAKRSRNRFVVGREGWKSLVVNISVCIVQGLQLGMIWNVMSSRECRGRWGDG